VARTSSFSWADESLSASYIPSPDPSGSTAPPTDRDLEFLGFGSSDVLDVTRRIREVCAVPADDGVVFDPAGIKLGVQRIPWSYRACPLSKTFPAHRAPSRSGPSPNGDLVAGVCGGLSSRGGPFLRVDVRERDLALPRIDFIDLHLAGIVQSAVHLATVRQNAVIALVRNWLPVLVH
jgi:hypothetical protein